MRPMNMERIAYDVASEYFLEIVNPMPIILVEGLKDLLYIHLLVCPRRWRQYMKASATTSAQTSWKIGTRYQYSALPTSTSMSGMPSSEYPLRRTYGLDLESVIAIVLRSTPVRKSKLGNAAKILCTRLIQTARSYSSLPVTSPSPDIPSKSPKSVWRTCKGKKALHKNQSHTKLT